MAKRKRIPKKKKGVPGRVKLFAALLIAVLVIGVGAVKLLRTSWGHVVLLDVGVTGYYSLVQEDLDLELRQPLEAFGLDRSLKKRFRSAHVRGGSYRVWQWDAACDGPCSPAKISLAFTKAAGRKGGVARSRIVETTHGEPTTILITVGSRRFPTHEITLRRPPAATHRSDAPPANTPVARPRPKLALVIDDFGYSRGELIELFLDLDLPLTIAVLPSLPRTQYVLNRAAEKGKPTLLHLPMEAENEEPDDMAIRTTMDNREIREMLDGYLRQSQGISGVNNHQGSLATRDRRVMLVVMSDLKERNLFFLDSLTSGESIAYNTAKSLDVPTARNDLFLDWETEDAAVVEDRLRQLIALARRHGHAIGIGHPKRWTYEAISRNVSALKQSGVDVVFVSALME